MTPCTWILFAALLPAADLPTAPVPDAELLAAVRPFPQDLLAPEPDGDRTHKILQAYYDSIRQWGNILKARQRPVPGRPGLAYYGRGGHLENDVRPLAYAALVSAFLAEAQPPGPALNADQRAQFRRQATAALRYLTHSHKTGGGTCLDGQPWGDQWQSAMWARSAGMAGWILWPHLDPNTQTAVARLVEHEADRFLDKQPKSSEFRDTGAEENAWNSMLLALACNMLPRHPHAAQWDQAARRYMYNSFSVAADHHDHAPGDLDRPISQWVTTVNAHPDFTVENHGLVHVGYLKNTAAMLMTSASHYLIVQQPMPRACFHHLGEAFDVLVHSMAWDAALLFFGGNDWKTYHSQPIDVVLYAMLNVARGDRRAAYLEETALHWLRRIQQQEGGFYSVRRDLEYGGLCASRLVVCYLAHAAAGDGAQPLSTDQFDRSADGVMHLQYGRVIVHRTPTKLASFSWGPKRMALALPRDGNWVIWPHFASYLGIIDGKDASARGTELVELNHFIQPDGFCVAGSLKRFDGRLVQDFAYASPAGDLTIYIERLTPAGGATAAAYDRQTGVVGHEYELCCNERMIYGAFGEKQMTGLGGPTTVHQWQTDWLNLGNRVGYVIRRQGGRPNVVRYHDLARGSGRVPKLQEWLSLIGDEDRSAWGGKPDWACLVTFLNQPAPQTADLAGRVAFQVHGNQATCRVGTNVLHVDFTAHTARLETAPSSSKNHD